MSTSPARRAPRRNPNVPAQTRTRGHGHASGTATPERSVTQTLTSAAPLPDGLVLRLRGAHEGVREHTDNQTQTETASGTGTETRRRIQWAEGTVDNEGLGRKKSKVCCIFHKSREVGESSSEDDSDSSSSDFDGGSGLSDDGAAKPVGGWRRGRGRGRKHRHDHDHGDGEQCGHGGEQGKRKPSPNAYERMPRYDVKPLGRQPGT